MQTCTEVGAAISVREARIPPPVQRMLIVIYFSTLEHDDDVPCASPWPAAEAAARATCLRSVPLCTKTTVLKKCCPDDAPFGTPPYRTTPAPPKYVHSKEHRPTDEDGWRGTRQRCMHASCRLLQTLVQTVAHNLSNQ